MKQQTADSRQQTADSRQQTADSRRSSHLLIIGTGGQGKVVLDCAEKYYNKITFMTNDSNTKKIENYPILFEKDINFEYILKNFDGVIVAIGNNNARLNLSLKYISQGIKLATIVHPTAVVSKYAIIGEGTVIFANAVVNSSARIGRACIINTGAIIEHDCILEDGVHISPNAAMGGTVNIGKKTWICLGSNIANNIKIGENVIVGAGSVVLNDVSDNVLVAGIPATIKKKYN
jgi:sugar O-acyltransferase (sialic acid O-acetyltransferase NeuD family)